jgi:hypothetical protein
MDEVLLHDAVAHLDAHSLMGDLSLCGEVKEQSAEDRQNGEL